MSLIRCRECGRAVSNAAATCPHCGADRQRTAKIIVGIVGGILLGIIGLWVLFNAVVVVKAP